MSEEEKPKPRKAWQVIVRILFEIVSLGLFLYGGISENIQDYSLWQYVLNRHTLQLFTSMLFFFRSVLNQQDQDYNISRETGGLLFLAIMFTLQLFLAFTLLYCFCCCKIGKIAANVQVRRVALVFRCDRNCLSVVWHLCLYTL